MPTEQPVAEVEAERIAAVAQPPVEDEVPFGARRVERAIGTRIEPRADTVVPHDVVTRLIDQVDERSVIMDAPSPYRHVAHELARPTTDEDASLEPDLSLDEDALAPLRTRDVARELLRARLIAIAERRERRSAWEIAFILLAASIAVLLSAPPLVQVFLAMHGVEA